MTRQMWFSGLVIAVAFSGLAFAQRGSTPSGSMAPPASLLTGGTHMSPGTATITSPSFGVRQNLGHYNPQFSGQHNGVPLRGTVPPRRDHGNRDRDHHRAVPYYGAYYPYYGFGYGYAEPVYVEDRSSLQGAGTFDKGNDYEEEDDRGAPTVFENRRPSEMFYRPRAGQTSVLDEATSRYGEQPATSREAARETGNGVVTANGNESNDITTLLIFKDGMQREVTNYAIMGQYIYVFVGDRRKIPLSEIDVDATIKANDARGSEFKVPSSADPS